MLHKARASGIARVADHAGNLVFSVVSIILVSSAGAVAADAVLKHADPGLSRSMKLPSRAQLQKFHRRLANLRHGRTRRLTIVQIGDSHTQAEHFSGRLRTLFQRRFGNAGRGFLPPGAPYSYWRPYRVTGRQSGPWTVFSSNRSDFAVLPYGLSGFVLRSDSPEAAISLTMDKSGKPFDLLDVGFYTRRNGGSFVLLVDGSEIATIETSGRTYKRVQRSFALLQPGRTIELRPLGDGLVDIADWSVYRDAPGVIVTTHGFSGAQVGILDRWHWPTVMAQLRQLDPALILLAFGTNEGYAPKKRLQKYRARLAQRVRALAAAAPNASIVLIGGPDANRIPNFCSPAVRASDATLCAPLNDEEVTHYDKMLARKLPRLCRWHTPGSYDLVRSTQLAVARETGVYLWDWFRFQGGKCGAFRWERKGLVLKDRVHMKRAGYWHSADQLYSLLMRSFEGQ